MAQWIRSLTAPPEDLDSITCSHMVVYVVALLKGWVSEILFLYAFDEYHPWRQNTHTHKIISKIQKEHCNPSPTKLRSSKLKKLRHINLGDIFDLSVCIWKRYLYSHSYCRTIKMIKAKKDKTPWYVCKMEHSVIKLNGILSFLGKLKKPVDRIQ